MRTLCTSLNCPRPSPSSPHECSNSPDGLNLWTRRLPYPSETNRSPSAFIAQSVTIWNGLPSFGVPGVPRRLNEPPVRVEFEQRMDAHIGAIDAVVGIDVDPMRRFEQPGSPFRDERAVRFKDGQRPLSARKHIDAVLRIAGDANRFAPFSSVGAAVPNPLETHIDDCRFQKS